MLGRERVWPRCLGFSGFQEVALEEPVHSSLAAHGADAREFDDKEEDMGGAN